MKFAIDIDGVLSSFTSAVIKASNDIWPNKLPKDYVPTNWNYEGALTKAEWNLVWVELMHTENLWLTLPSLAGVAQLQVFFAYYPNTEVYYITSRPQTRGMSSLVQTTQWLEQRNLWPRFDRSHVIVVNKPTEKEQFIQDLKLPFYLDDYGPTIQSVQKITNAWLLDAPYNREYALPRVFSVREFLDKVEKYP